MLNYSVKILVDKLLETISSQSEKEAFSFDITEYLSNLFDRFRVTKNILHRDKPVDFYDSYLPITLTADSKTIRSTDLIEVISNYDKLVVLGTAGSGKTTLLKFVTLQCIDQAGGIPVYVELRNYNELEGSFEDFIIDSVTESKSSMKSSIRSTFKSGKFVFLLDGFDEINYREDMGAIHQIERFISKYSLNTFVITSRHGTNIESLSHFYVFEIAPLNIDDISLYLSKLNVSRRLKDEINRTAKHDGYFLKYLTNPLILSIYINYLESHADQDIPKKKSVFFRAVLDTLFSQHDSITKLGFIRNRLSGLSKGELEKVASLLAFRAFITSVNCYSKDDIYKELDSIKEHIGITFENENALYDLIITTSILVSDNTYYSFIHVLFLEYLAALFVSSSPEKSRQHFYIRIVDSRKARISPSIMNFMYELDEIMFLEFYFIPSIEKYLKHSFAPGTKEASAIELFSEVLINNINTQKDRSRKHRIDINDRIDIKGLVYILKDRVRAQKDDPLDDFLGLI